MKYKIYNQDVLDWAKEYDKGKFHALLCDPPYHLTSIVKRFGNADLDDDTYTSEKVRNRSDGYSRLIGTGFMGQTWDGGDVAFRPETWEAIGEHLYDGAFGMAFSASRNWHRLAVAIEDAGFIIHPTIFGWLNGQGFPKATRVKGQEVFDGHRYGLQALKPAIEPIIVFQKPYEGRPIDNIIQTGAGALNIDAGRIPVAKNDRHEYGVDGDEPSHTGVNDYGEYGRVAYQQHEQGRWPANFLLDGVTAPMLDAQTGTLTSGIPSGTRQAKNNIYGQYAPGQPVTGFGDSGGASRFFYNVSNQIDEADPIYYCAKVSKKERNAGLDDLPDKVFAQSGGAQASVNRGEDEYKQDSIGINRVTQRKNIHPTVKPIDLATYLAKLLLPPDEYAPRRILVPFSGVGSEMIGCAMAGWEQIVGVEFDTENGYVDIAKKRIEYWTSK